MSASIYFHAEHDNNVEIKAELHARPGHLVSVYVALTIGTSGSQVCVFLTPEQADEVAQAIVNR